jgi:hypothetical protein
MEFHALHLSNGLLSACFGCIVWFMSNSLTYPGVFFNGWHRSTLTSSAQNDHHFDLAGLP